MPEEKRKISVAETAIVGGVVVFGTLITLAILASTRAGPRPPGVAIDFPELTILDVEGIPFIEVNNEVGLSEPIVMSEMRGISLTWLNKTITPEPGFGMWWYLRYEPQFTAPMPPPGFALRPGAIPPVGQEAVADILGCWAGGYYYPGIYDGVVNVSHMYGEYWSTFEHSFRIKNLAQVTGTGTVVPPGY